MTDPTSVLLDALREVQGCFQAAYIEGLDDRLSEAPDGDPGNLRGLIERRLLPMLGAVDKALATYAASCPKEQQLMDQMIYGYSISKDGQRIDPCEVLMQPGLVKS